MKCEHCGFEQPESKFCERCGRMMARIRRDDADKATDDAVKGVVILKCHRCGHEQAGGRICEGCGIMLDVYREAIDDDEDKVILCPTCAVPSRTSRCRNCGERIPGFPEDEE